MYGAIEETTEPAAGAVSAAGSTTGDADEADESDEGGTGPVVGEFTISGLVKDLCMVPMLLMVVEL